MIPLVIAAALDLATFAWAAALHPIAGEYNPLARLFYIHAGLLGVALLKGAVTIGALLILGRLDKLRRWGVGAAVGLTLAFAGLNLVAVAVLL